METLNYDVLAKSGYNGYILKNAPERSCSSAKATFFAHLLTIGSTLPTRRQTGTASVFWSSPSPRVLPR